MVDAGYHVRIFCTAEPGLPGFEVQHGVEYSRLALVFPSPIRSLRRLAKTRTNTAGAGRATGPGATTPVKRWYSAKRLLTILAAPGHRFLLEVYRNLALVAAPHIFRASSVRQIVSWRPDAVHAHELVTLPAAAVVAGDCDASLVYDSHEFERHRNPPSPAPVRNYLHALEHRFGRRADLIITVSRPIAEILEQELQRAVILVHNSPLIAKAPAGANVRADLRLPENSPLVVYVGALLPNRGLEQLIRAHRWLPGYHFAIVGPGAPRVRTALAELVDALHLTERIHFLPPVPPEQVVHYIKTADVGTYAIQNACLSYDFCMPGKLFEMTLAGLPLAVSDLRATRDFVARFGHGRLFSPDDLEDIARTIRRVYEDRQDLKLRDSARHAVIREFGWSAQATTLIRAYDQLERRASTPRRSQRPPDECRHTGSM